MAISGLWLVEIGSGGSWLVDAAYLEPGRNHTSSSKFSPLSLPKLKSGLTKPRRWHFLAKTWRTKSMGRKRGVRFEGEKLPSCRWSGETWPSRSDTVPALTMRSRNLSNSFQRWWLGWLRRWRWRWGDDDNPVSIRKKNTLNFTAERSAVVYIFIIIPGEWWYHLEYQLCHLMDKQCIISLITITIMIYLAIIIIFHRHDLKSSISSP